MCLMGLLACLTSIFSKTRASAIPDNNNIQSSIADGAVLNDTEFALLYSNPLVSFALYAAPYLATNGSAGINTPFPQRELSTSDSKQIVKPNSDTLYTPIVYDLSKDDLLVHVPEFVAGKYWSFSFFDPYGDNYKALGSADATEPGDYLLKLKGSSSEHRPSDGVSATGVIESTTAYGVILVRYLVTASNETSVKEVNAIQDKIKITKVPRACGQEDDIPNLYSIIKDYVQPALTWDEPARQLSLLAKLETNNQPLTVSARPSVAQRLQNAGVANDEYSKPPGLNLTEAAHNANLTHFTFANDLANYRNMGNNWGLAATIGNYGTHWVERSVIGQSSYLAMIPRYQMYPTWLPTITSTASLAKGQAYLLTFFGKPPVKWTGYWSVTMYNADFFLVENELDRYQLGDRSNMTYPDGKLIYGDGDGEDAGTDGEFQMLIQAADARPPGNWTANWLPAPRSGKAMTFNLRFGVPSKALNDGTYTYPKVEKIDAIVA